MLPFLSVFTVGARAGHASFLLAGVPGKFKGERLVHVDGGLAVSRHARQLEAAALHGLHRQMLLA